MEKLTGLKLDQYPRTKGKPYRFGTDEFVSPNDSNSLSSTPSLWINSPKRGDPRGNNRRLTNSTRRVCDARHNRGGRRWEEGGVVERVDDYLWKVNEILGALSSFFWKRGEEKERRNRPGMFRFPSLPLSPMLFVRTVSNTSVWLKILRAHVSSYNSSASIQLSAPWGILYRIIRIHTIFVNWLMPKGNRIPDISVGNEFV